MNSYCAPGHCAANFIGLLGYRPIVALPRFVSEFVGTGMLSCETHHIGELAEVVY